MRPLTEITTEIRRLDRESAESVWTIGKLLNEAKLNTPHGQYSEWVLRELKFSASYAARLVRLYNEYSSGFPEGFAISTLLCTLPLEESLRDQVNQIILIAESTTQEAEALRSQAQKDAGEIAAKLARLKDAQPDPVNLDKVREEIRAELRAEFEASKPKKQKDNSADMEALRAEAVQSRELSEELARQEAATNEALQKVQDLRAQLISAESKAKIVPVRHPVEVVVPPADYDELKQLAAEVPALREAVRVLNEQRSKETIKPVKAGLLVRRKEEYINYLLSLAPEGTPDFQIWLRETYSEEYREQV